MARSPLHLLILAALAALPLVAGCGQKGASGAELFSLHCASCHPEGGNTVRPDKTLHPKDLRAHNIRSPHDIVEKMRNPGPGMPRFTPAMITDRESVSIAEYILATFH